MPIETEIKFTVQDKNIFKRVSSLVNIAGYKPVDKGVTLHTDTYFDTQDFQLYHGEIVLRLRSLGNETILTFKARGQSNGEIHRRIEIEHRTETTVDDIANGRFPDILPVKALYERIGRVKLSPCLTAKNNRHTILLTKKDEPHFELVLDDVVFSGTGGEKNVCELEIESLTGMDEELRKIGSWFAERYKLKPAGPSKYILGMKLVGFGI